MKNPIADRLLNIVILAAGQGKRMQSALPKVLHPLAGKPLLTHVIHAVQQLNPAKINVVYGHGGAQVRTALADLPVQWIEQKEQLGTGHALLRAMPFIENNARVLVLFGDVPLISLNTLQKLLVAASADEIAVLTAQLPNPAGLGRIIRNAANQLVAIVEDKDATAEQKEIKEINTGILIASADNLKRWLPMLNNHNTQVEYYYPEIIPMAVAENITINTVSVAEPEEGQGINDRLQLAQLERYYQREQAKKLMLAGVTLLDPERFDLRGAAQIASDVTIDINVILEGEITIGAHALIGANTFLRNVKIGANVIIKANSFIEDAVIEDHCEVGPFARIRPGTLLRKGAQVGNFAEIKNSDIGADTKVHHVSYIGDTTLGKKVNIGAGTITCNYDGANKHKTIIGDNAFIGSNTALIAPVTIGENATVGAGSAIKRNVPDNALALTRGEQRIFENWPRPTKIE